VSLNIYLVQPKTSCVCGGICHSHTGEFDELFDANITHNLNKMAEAAGIYDIIWRPDENNVRSAGEIIERLDAGIADMKARPEHFKQFNPENGWGSYDAFMPWLDKLLAACKEYPNAEIKVSR
jgi:hypothetical protein